MGIRNMVAMIVAVGCAACSGAPVSPASGSAVRPSAPVASASVPAAAVSPVAAPSPEAHDLSEVLAEACLHMEKGPAEAVAADSATVLTMGHRRLDVTLNAKDGQYAGTISVAVDEAGEAVLLMGAAIPVVVRQGGRSVTLAPLKQALVGCPAGTIGYELDLEVGPAQIVLGPAPTARVSVVFEAAEEHEDGEDGKK